VQFKQTVTMRCDLITQTNTSSAIA